MLRKAATISTPVMEITNEGDTWTIKTSTTLKTMELKFKVSIYVSVQCFRNRHCRPKLISAPRIKRLIYQGAAGDKVQGGEGLSPG